MATMYPTSTKTAKPTTDKPFAENPSTGKPTTENPPQLSNKELTTKKLTTKKSSTEEKKKERKSASAGYDAILSELITDEEVKATLYEFIKMRAMIKKPLTDYALRRLISKLEKMAFDPRMQVEILERSILNNWQDIYEPKAEQQQQQQKKQQQGSGNPFLDLAREEHII